MGKRKISMIENDQYRMVSFSKRRKGLFKKAEELSKLTGATIAVLVVSQAGRPHSSLSPPFHSLNSFVDEFLSAAEPPISGDSSEIGFFADPLCGDFYISVDELLAPQFPGDGQDQTFSGAADASSVSLGSFVDGFLSAEVAGDGAASIGDLLGGDWSESLGEPLSVSDYISVDDHLSASDGFVLGAGTAASSIGELLAAEIDCLESVDELLALKEKLEGLREEVRSVLDSQFVNSLCSLDS